MTAILSDALGSGERVRSLTTVAPTISAMTTEAEFDAAGLLDGANVGGGRLELLEWLDSQGFSIDEMLEAFKTGALGALAGDRRLVPGEQLTRLDAIERSGLEADRFDELAIAFGFGPVAATLPGHLAFTAREAEVIAVFGAITEMFTDEESLGFVRVLGSSVARIADAAVSLFLTDVESPHLAAAGGELELAQKVYDAIGLLDQLVPSLDPVLRRHVLQATERSRLSLINDVERMQYRYAVGFVDLVGFTPISNGMEARELGVFIREFEGRAHDAVTTAGARLVKLIGDEVMFVAADPAAAYEVARALMTGFATAAGREVLPRGGLAYGEVISRGGDYYGSVVNLASRLVDEAEPRELLVSSEFAEATTYIDFKEAGHRTLKGFTDPVPALSALFS